MSNPAIRWDRTTAFIVYDKVMDSLKPLLSRWSIAGSWRRQAFPIGDIDILVIPLAGVSDNVVNKALASICVNGKLQTSGSGLSVGMVPLGNGDEVSVNVFFTNPEEWGSALLYTTGSRKFNVLFRGIAKSRGFMVNQYGVFKGDKLIPDSGFSERAVCRTIGVRWLEPTQRTGDKGPWIVGPGYISKHREIAGVVKRTASPQSLKQPLSEN